ncbi:hypothetical protein L6R52_16800 [Myxococcota bacterium]|nr:hypothetical protein [Myxococcota bacterium]
MDAKKTGLVVVAVVAVVYATALLWPAGEGTPEARGRAIETLGELFTRPLDRGRIDGDCRAVSPGAKCTLRVAPGGSAERADVVLAQGLEADVELVPADPDALGLTARLDAARGPKQTLTFTSDGARLEATCLRPAPSAKTCALELVPR